MTSSVGERQYEIVLLGATGYTGKYTAEYIVKHLPTNLRWAVAGRSASKLNRVIEEVKQFNPDRETPAVEVCNLDAAELNALAKKTTVLINTIGPYHLYSEPVVKACVETGTHYVDCTGECVWVKEMIDKYEQTAKKTGAIVRLRSFLRGRWSTEPSLTSSVTLPLRLSLNVATNLPHPTLLPIPSSPTFATTSTLRPVI